MEDNDAILKALQDCARELRELKTGERLVDQAEQAFGHLADTVDTVLHERRVVPDRRAVVRANSDRRRNPRGAE